MSRGKDSKVLEFNLEGRFLGFNVKDGYKLKYLQLATATGEYQIKLPKELRASLGMTLTPGEWIKVFGAQTIDLKSGNVKFKAVSLVAATPSHTKPLEAFKPASTKAANILVCQKSDCCKRGGKEVCKALQSAISDRGLEGQVTIKGTGCMKDCKAGPNIIFMPDKTRYSRITAKDVPALFDKHFPAEVEAEQKIPESVTTG